MARHGMIDLETMATTPDCVVLTLGAVKFYPDSLDEPDQELYFRLELDTQVEKGRVIDESTLEWWGNQDQEAQDEAFGEENRVDTREALEQLRKWCMGLDTIWGQGYGFDLTILENLYRTYDMPVPWKFYQVKDSRTLFGIMPKDPRKQLDQTGKHNALSDAYFQAKGVQLVYKHIQELTEA